MSEETAGAAEPAKQNQQGQEQTSGNVKDETVVLTKEDYEKRLQSEADKRVTNALKTAKQKWEEEYSKKLEQERAEAERMGKLSQEEKERVLLQKREEELAKRETEVRRQKMHLEAIKVLEEKKLPTNFAAWLLGKDADETFGNIQAFEKAFQEAVTESVQARLPRVSPRVGISPPAGGRAVDDLIRRAAAGKRRYPM